MIQLKHILSKNKRYLIAISMLLVLLLIPLFWIESVKINIAKFTEEWYKAIFIYLGVGFIIVLFTDMDKEIKKEELIDHRKDVIKEIVVSENLKGNFRLFLQITDKINLRIGNECLDEDGIFAKKEMEYYIKNSDRDPNKDYSTTINNIIRKLGGEVK